MTAAKRYSDANHSVGLTQVAVWVPEKQADSVMAFADNLRLQHYTDAIERGNKAVLSALSRRNRRTLPSLPGFEDTFENVGAFMTGGHMNKQAKRMYADLAKAFKSYVELESELKTANIAADLEAQQTTLAKLYVSALNINMLRSKITLLVAEEKSRPL